MKTPGWYDAVFTREAPFTSPPPKQGVGEPRIDDGTGDDVDGAGDDVVDDGAGDCDRVGVVVISSVHDARSQEAPLGACSADD
jgi:hypothetical protein